MKPSVIAVSVAFVAIIVAVVIALCLDSTGTSAPPTTAVQAQTATPQVVYATAAPASENLTWARYDSKTGQIIATPVPTATPVPLQNPNDRPFGDVSKGAVSDYGDGFQSTPPPRS